MADESVSKLGYVPVRVSDLKEHPNFAQFEDKDFEVFSSYCKEKHLAKGALLFQEGEPGEVMFFVRHGEIRVFKAGFLGEITIAKIYPGEFVGEMAVIDGSVRSAATRAASDADLLELSIDDLNRLKKENPAVAIKVMDILLKLLTSRLRLTTQKMLKKEQ
jgi:CRP/FNR family transcriptional regulator, cyclic AMP receptor protein